MSIEIEEQIPDYNNFLEELLSRAVEGFYPDTIVMELELAQARVYSRPLL